MALFGRKNRARAVSKDAELQQVGRLVQVGGAPDEADAPDDDGRIATDAQAESAETSLPEPTPKEPLPEGGPFDIADVADLSDRMDFGALRIGGIPGMQLQLEVESETGQATKITATLAGSSLELSAFAAPKTWGIWAEIRAGIVEGVVAQGGTAEEVDGRCGTELRTRIPRRGRDGRTTFHPARFLGVDGPRWFLRGVITGPAAADDAAAAPLVDVFRATVVDRGDQAMAPREVLPLTIPDELAAQLPEGEKSEDAPPAESRFGPLERGPEITEIH